MANTKITSNVISDDINLGGNPTTTTQSAGNDTTRIATTAFVKAAIDATIDSAPGALDTLNELAAAIGDDANFSTTITNSIATKLPLAGGTLTGDLTLSSGTSNKPKLTITNTNADSTPPYLILKKDSASPADNDEVGRIYMYGDDDAGNVTEAFLAIGKMTDVSNGAETSSLDMYTYTSGAQASTLTLKGGQVAIGHTSPGYQVHIKKTGSAEIELEGTVSAELNLHDSGGSADSRRARLSMNGTDFKLSALNDADDTVTHEFISMQTDTGMVGIAKAAPIAWSSGYKSLQIGGRGYIGAHSGSDLYVGQNAYYNSGWKYEASVAASLTQHSGGQITHKVAAAGTAGNAISWINAIHIKPTGEVGIQTTAPQAKLSVNTPLTQASADLRAIDIVVPGSWSLSGNAGHTSDITWTNAEAAGYVMGKFGLRYAGTSTGGNSEFVFKDMYHGGYGASVDAMYVGSNGIVMHPNQPYFEVYRSGNETGFNASNSYAQVVVYNNAQSNVGGHYNTSTGYFTAPVTGVYSFVAAAYTNFTCGQAWFSSTGGRLGGTDMVLNGMGQFPAAWIIIRMAANDTIGFHPYASGTTSGTINANGNHTYFRGALIG